MLKKAKKRIRAFLRGRIATPNTIRYRIEYRCIEKLLRAAMVKPGSLLDAGAGSGEMSKKLLHAGLCRSLTGVEPFKQNFLILQENWGELPGAKPIQAGLENLPLENGSFDLVLSCQVFEHIQNHEQAAREVARALRHGGHALISVPHPPEISPGEEHVRPGYTEAEMRALMEPCGFEFLAAEYFFTYPTLRRLFCILELPWLGWIVSPAWADQESGLTNEERKKMNPYGIACLFRKL